MAFFTVRLAAGLGHEKGWPPHVDSGVTIGIGTLITAIAALLSAMTAGMVAVWRVLQATNSRLEAAQNATIARIEAAQNAQIARIVTDKDAQIVRERERADRWEAMYRASIERLEYSLDLGGAPQVNARADRRSQRPVPST